MIEENTDKKFNGVKMIKIVLFLVVVSTPLFAKKYGIGWNGDLILKMYQNKFYSTELSIDPGFRKIKNESIQKQENTVHSFNLGIKYLYDKEYSDLLLFSPFVEAFYGFSENQSEVDIEDIRKTVSKSHKLVLGCGIHPGFIIKEHLILRVKFGIQGVYNYQENISINNLESTKNNSEGYSFVIFGEKFNTQTGLEFIWLF